MQQHAEHLTVRNQPNTPSESHPESPSSSRLQVSVLIHIFSATITERNIQKLQNHAEKLRQINAHIGKREVTQIFLDFMSHRHYFMLLILVQWRFLSDICIKLIGATIFTSRNMKKE